MDEYALRELVSAEFSKQLGGGQHERWARIPYVNKTSRILAGRFDLIGWPPSEELGRHVQQAVAEYA